MEAVKSRLARGYSRSAPLYDALAGEMYLAGLRRLLPRLHLPPMPAILDVGCGTALNLLEAARWYFPARRLVGIDLAPGMVEVARAKAATTGIPAEFVVGDAESLPFPDGNFDLVICNSVFHWFRDRAAAMREMARVLSPGGQLALICAANGGFAEWFSLMDLVSSLVTGQPTAGSTPAFPTVQEVGLHMQTSGLAPIHLANPARIHRVSDPENFYLLMSTVAPTHAADLTDDQRHAAQALAVHFMRSRLPAGFPCTWSAIEAIGARVQ